MATVTPGPMPADGTSIVPANVLPAFVNGTDISDLDNDAFASDLTFIASQTDTPAVRWPGTMWFKRGEGQLYWAQTIDASNYTSVWCKLHPTYEILMQIDSSSYSAFPGQAVTLGQDPYRATEFTAADGSGRQTWRCNTHVVSSGSSNTGMMWTRFILQDTGVTEGPVRVTVWGKATALFGSGASVVRGDHMAHVSKYWEARGCFQGWWYSYQYETAHSGAIIQGLVMSESAYTSSPNSYDVFFYGTPMRGPH